MSDDAGADLIRESVKGVLMGAFVAVVIFLVLVLGRWSLSLWSQVDGADCRISTWRADSGWSCVSPPEARP